MHAIRVSRRVSRFDEIVQDMLNALRADDRHRTDGGVADDCAAADKLDRPWVGSVAIEPTTRNEARSTTASRDSASHVTSARGVVAAAASTDAGGERRCGGERDELATVHGTRTARLPGVGAEALSSPSHRYV